MDEVLVLMSTYNGEKYLQEQLNSLYSQQGVKVNILVRDDGSSDATKMILEQEQNKGRLNWYTGDNKRPAGSFMDLVYNAPVSEWYAFCDQDDIWLPDKLSIAINKMKMFQDEKPSLYYGHPRLVDSDLNSIPSSVNTYDKMLDFYSSMINSNATGCTMVFNRKLLELIKREKPGYIAMHDGWFHKVCIIARGNLVYDEDVHICYRQHSGNVIGSATSLKKKVRQRLLSLRSMECIRSRTIKSLVECYSDLMTEEEKEIAMRVASYKTNVFSRIALATDFRIKTNYNRRNVMFRLAVLVGAF